MRKVALCLVLVSAFISSVDAENLVAVPQLQTRVTDLTGTLSTSTTAIFNNATLCNTSGPTIICIEQ
jgi:uncharacterized membrane protein YgcG